jgi:Histidine kinase-, DNA gyrase B-, and HSP90-like ATPase
VQATNRETSVRVGHVYLDVSRKLLHFLNPTARQLREEGLPLIALDPEGQQLFTPQGEAATAADLPLVQASRKGMAVEATFFLPRSSGPPWLVNWTAVPLRDTGGRIIGVLGSVTCAPPEPDWQGLAELAHDLATPLHALGLQCAVLDRLPAGEEVQRTLGAIRWAAARALEISRQLLDCCRGPAPRRVAPQHGWFVLEPFLADLAEEQTPGATRKGLVLRTDFAAVRGWEIRIARVSLSRVLANLLVNAVRYTGQGHVDFTASWRGAGAERVLALSVIDTGAGISEEEKASIFHPFERGQAGKDSDSLGSGLGLTVVERLVGEMGLTLEVASEAGHGSAFHLLLPADFLRLASVAKD